MASFNNPSLFIEKKYEEWQENLSEIYDVFVKERLSSPSLTVQWLPSTERKRGGRAPKRIGKLRLKQRLVIGSSNNDKDNHLKIASILFSEKRLKTHIDRMHSKPNLPTCFIKMGTQIKHPGIVNRARYMPQNPAVLATKSSNGDVYIYDVRKICSASKVKEPCDPKLKLKGLSAGGSGLSWNPNRKGYIVSCSINERTIRLWDINSKANKDGNDNSLNKFNRGHPLGVKDCSWHCLHSSLFGSSGKDKSIHIWDIRADCTKMPAITGTGHKSSVNCLSFNYFSDHLLATGSSDQTIAVWDLRKMKSPCHRIFWHQAEIFQLHWSPNNESILATSGDDERILVWDISAIGAHQTHEEAMEGPPELLFIHGGHFDNILDFSWNLTEPWLLSSVSQDNVIQVWQMANHIYDNKISKKSSRLKPSKPKELLKNLATPGSSKSLSQAHLDSTSFKSSKISEAMEPANIMEGSKSLESPIFPKSLSSAASTSTKDQKSAVKTCVSEEASDYLAIPGPSNALDLASDFLLPSDSPLHNAFPFVDELEMLLRPLPCLSPLSDLSFENSSPESSKQSTSMDLPKSSLSPLSKSSLEGSPQSVASLELPEFPTSMESPESLGSPSTPESVKSAVLSSSESPTPPKSAKAILLPYRFWPEKDPNSPIDTENTGNQEKHEAGAHSNLSDSSPDCQSSIPAPYEFSTFFTDSTTGIEALRSMPPSKTCWYSCQGYEYSSKCHICYYLRKLNEGDQLSSYDWKSPPMFFSPPHTFSPEATDTSNRPTFSEIQNLADDSQSADFKIPNPSIYSNDPITSDFQISGDCGKTQDFKTPSDVILFPGSQEPAKNPSHSETTASQVFQMLPEIHQSGDILEPLDSHETSDRKIMKDIKDYIEELIFLNFQTPPVSPASQNMITTEGVSVHPQDNQNIQEFQDECVSTINNINNPNILAVSDFHSIAENPSTSDILYFESRPQNQDSPTSRDVSVLSEVPPYQDLNKYPDSLEGADILDSPDV